MSIYESDLVLNLLKIRTKQKNTSKGVLNYPHNIYEKSLTNRR